MAHRGRNGKQLFDLERPVNLRAALTRVHVSPAGEGLREQEDTASSVAFVLIVHTFGSALFERDRLTYFT